MCIICVCEGKRLSDAEIDNCWSANKDGAGVGWVENGRVKYKKGFMNLDDLKSFYHALTVMPHVVHFRTGTSGGYSALMTHPFIVNDEGTLSLEYDGEESVLFHNGVISDWKEMALTYFLSNGIRIPCGAWSDTRALAVLCSRLGYPVLDFIYGKFVIIHKSGRIDKLGVFNTEDGNYYSTTDYKTKSYSYGYGACGVEGGASSFRYGGNGSTRYVKESNNDVTSHDLSTTIPDNLIENKNYWTEDELEALEMIMGGHKNTTSSPRLDKLIEGSDEKYNEWVKRCRWVLSRDLKVIKGTALNGGRKD